MDNYLLFYFEFLRLSPTDENYFLHLANSPKKTNWEGRAFEQTCLNNISSIKQALGISGVHTEISSFRCKEDNEKGIKGHQIDLVIERDDRIIHLCEMKFYQSEFVNSSSNHLNLVNKIERLKGLSSKKKNIQILPTLITTFGLKKTEYWQDFARIITLNDLFR